MYILYFVADFLPGMFGLLPGDSAWAWSSYQSRDLSSAGTVGCSSANGENAAGTQIQTSRAAGRVLAGRRSCVPSMPSLG